MERPAFGCWFCPNCDDCNSADTELSTGSSSTEGSSSNSHPDAVADDDEDASNGNAVVDDDKVASNDSDQSGALSDHDAISGVLPLYFTDDAIELVL